MIKNYPRGYEYPTEIPTKIWNEYNLDFKIDYYRNRKLG